MWVPSVRAALGFVVIERQTYRQRDRERETGGGEHTVGYDDRERDMHTYIHTYIHTNIQTYIHTYRQRNRQTDRQKVREKERDR